MPLAGSSHTVQLASGVDGRVISTIRFSILEPKEVWDNTKIQCNKHRNTQLNRVRNHVYPSVINNHIFLKSISLFSPISLPFPKELLSIYFLPVRIFYFAAVLHV